MKKLLLIGILALCGLVLNVSCDPTQNAWSWNIKNSTGQTLLLKYPNYTVHEFDFGYHTVTIMPGDSYSIFSSTNNLKTNLSFDYFFSQIFNIYGEDVYWQIMSESGEVLRTWDYSDMGISGQTFFEETSWHLFTDSDKVSGFIDRSFIWVFDILPEYLCINNHF
ncbi:MAG: hypothetical protein LBM63_01680 [Rikenellaceae bacterium]|jgi:hypothetical protein|nr:hypothetical protein [Rikenellaceae bacterium]